MGEPPPTPAVHPGITLATCRPGRRATKIHHGAESTYSHSTPYDAGHDFGFKAVATPDLRRLHDVLRWLAGQPTRFVVAGHPAPWAQGVWTYRRSQPRPDEPASLLDLPSRVVMVDFEGAGRFDPADPGSAAEALRDRLGWGQAGFIWRASASAGIKPGVRLHLWAIANRPISTSCMKRWAESLDLDGLDLAVYTPAQPRYTADPIFDGLEDPIRHRLEMWPGPALDVDPWVEAEQAFELAERLDATRRQRQQEQARQQRAQAPESSRVRGWLEDRADELAQVGRGARHLEIKRHATWAAHRVAEGALRRDEALELLDWAVEGFGTPERHKRTIRDCFRAVGV